MAKSKQDHRTNDKRKNRNISDGAWLRECIQASGKTQAEIARASAMEPSRLSKLMNGGDAKLDLNDVIGLLFGLKMRSKDLQRLIESTDPSFKIALECLDKGMDILQTNEKLYAEGLPALGIYRKDQGSKDPGAEDPDS